MQSLSVSRPSIMITRQSLQMKYRRTGSSLSTTAIHRRRQLPIQPCRSSLTGKVRKNASSTEETRTGFFAWYTKQLDERPWTTKIISSALIAAAGDIVCQLLENNFAVDSSNDDDGAVANSNETTLYSRAAKEHIFLLPQSCHLDFAVAGDHAPPNFYSEDPLILRPTFLSPFCGPPDVRQTSSHGRLTSDG